MPPKRPTKSPLASVPKRARKVMTLEEKMDIIKRYNQGQRTADIVKATGVSESTLRTIRAAKAKIEESIAQGSSSAAKKTHIVRCAALQKSEEMLKDWIHKNVKRGIPLIMPIIQTKAREIYAEVSKNDSEPKPFSASSGWFANFKIRHGFHTLKFSGEAASADAPAAEAFKTTIKEYVENHGYRGEQIFNLDETALYPYRTFDRTYLSIEEKKKPGFKASKQRITIMVGTNLVGYRLKPVVIGKSEKAHCFKGVIIENLPVYYYHSPKSWMTSYIWGHYTSFNVENELRAYCREVNVDFKILILCDNFSGHNESYTVSSEHITIMFLTPNTTSLIQPMDQGIISMFKGAYHTISLQRMVQQIDMLPDADDSEVVRDYWKQFNLKNVIYLIYEAWETVTLHCIQGSWRRLLPQIICDFVGFSMVEEVAKMKNELLNQARQVGYNEVDEEEVDKLLASHDQDLTMEELLQMQNEREEEAEQERTKGNDKTEDEVKQMTSKDISRMFSCIDKAMKIMEDHDPQQERVCKVQQNTRQSLRCYYEIQRNLRASAKQRTIEAYFTRPAEREPERVTPEPEPQPSTSRQSPESQTSTSTKSPNPQVSTSTKSPFKKRQMTLYESYS